MYIKIRVQWSSQKHNQSYITKNNGGNLGTINKHNHNNLLLRIEKNKQPTITY